MPIYLGGRKVEPVAYQTVDNEGFIGLASGEERVLFTSGGGSLGEVAIKDSNLKVEGSIIFEGVSEDAFESTLTVVDPTADRTITLPDVTGTVITTGNLSDIAQDLDFQGDAGGALSIDLDSETLTIAGGVGLSSAGATNTLTINLDNTTVTAGSYGSSSAIPAVTVDAQGRITALSTNAISSSFTLSADTGTNDTFNVGDTLTFAGGTNIATVVSDDTITFNTDDSPQFTIF